MMQFSPELLNDLQWEQDSAFSRAYELRSGAHALASLRFAKLMGTLAEATTPAGGFTFKRNGFLKSVVTARPAGSEQVIATYEPNFLGSRGRIQLSTGEALELYSSNFWSSEWVVADSNQTGLLCFHNKGMLRTGASVDASPAFAARPDQALLVTFCWYLLVLHMMDAAATTVICCS